MVIVMTTTMMINVVITKAVASFWLGSAVQQKKETPQSFPFLFMNLKNVF